MQSLYHVYETWAFTLTMHAPSQLHKMISFFLSTEVYLESSQTFLMGPFSKNSQQQKVVYYFCKNVPP